MCPYVKSRKRERETESMSVCVREERIKNAPPLNNFEAKPYLGRNVFQMPVSNIYFLFSSKIDAEVRKQELLDHC